MRKIAMLIAFFLLAVCACGVKGPPRPPDLAKPAQPADGGLTDGGE
jgi:predicted small lipoprotein YifL